MSFSSIFRNPAALGFLNITTLLGLGGSTYLLRSHMMELSKDHEARMVCESFIFVNSCFHTFIFWEKKGGSVKTDGCTFSLISWRFCLQTLVRWLLHTVVIIVCRYLYWKPIWYFLITGREIWASDPCRHVLRSMWVLDFEDYEWWPLKILQVAYLQVCNMALRCEPPCTCICCLCRPYPRTEQPGKMLMYKMK
jgi:hypothetical protein